jgi:glycolate oxidase FAD binding subunit
LWRLALPATTGPLALHGDQLIEWNGAQRWWKSDLPAHEIRTAARAAGGHATLFRSPNRSTTPDAASVFSPLDAVQMRLHRNLKHAFDPYHVFSPGRMYSDF